MGCLLQIPKVKTSDQQHTGVRGLSFLLPQRVVKLMELKLIPLISTNFPLLCLRASDTPIEI